MADNIVVQEVLPYLCEALGSEPNKAEFDELQLAFKNVLNALVDLSNANEITMPNRTVFLNNIIEEILTYITEN